MLNTATEVSSNLPERSVIMNEVVGRCINLHRQFHLESWTFYCREKLSQEKIEINNPPSFHNHYHVQATLAASGKLVDQVKKMEGGEDPFKLREDLIKYNQDHGSAITIDEFADCVRIAFAAHDLGDIGEIKDNKFSFFTDGYYPGTESEQRSTQIIEWILKDLIDAPLKNLVSYLIKETNYTPNKLPDPNIPFARFMRFVDFVGNGFFNANEDRFLGLILELYNRKNEEEKESWTLDLPAWFNAVDKEFNKYVIERPGERQKILKIWGKEEWRKRKKLPKGQTNVRNWLIETHGRKQGI